MMYIELTSANSTDPTSPYSSASQLQNINVLPGLHPVGSENRRNGSNGHFTSSVHMQISHLPTPTRFHAHFLTDAHFTNILTPLTPCNTTTYPDTHHKLSAHLVDAQIPAAVPLLTWTPYISIPLTHTFTPLTFCCHPLNLTPSLTFTLHAYTHQMLSAYPLLGQPPLK